MSSSIAAWSRADPTASMTASSSSAAIAHPCHMRSWLKCTSTSHVTSHLQTASQPPVWFMQGPLQIPSRLSKPLKAFKKPLKSLWDAFWTSFRTEPLENLQGHLPLRRSRARSHGRAHVWLRLCHLRDAHLPWALPVTPQQLCPLQRCCRHLPRQRIRRTPHSEAKENDEKTMKKR